MQNLIVHALDRGASDIHVESFEDNPDFIFVCDDIPVLVYEHTGEASSGHNAGQRLARLACAMEEAGLVMDRKLRSLTLWNHELLKGVWSNDKLSGGSPEALWRLVWPWAG